MCFFIYYFAFFAFRIPNASDWTFGGTDKVDQLQLGWIIGFLLLFSFSFFRGHLSGADAFWYLYQSTSGEVKTSQVPNNNVAPNFSSKFIFYYLSPSIWKLHCSQPNSISNVFGCKNVPMNKNCRLQLCGGNGVVLARLFQHSLYRMWLEILTTTQCVLVIEYHVLRHRLPFQISLITILFLCRLRVR